MRYVVQGQIIKSENAAKPYNQKSKAIDEYLLSKCKKNTVLDYGCGKLRYADSLIKIGKKVTFVDSELQLKREQIIRGEKTNISDYVNRHYPNCEVISIETIDSHTTRYDLITCTNVLSAIPCEEALSKAISNIRNLLKPGGTAIFVNQHRSSYFKKYQSGKKHLHGYLYSGRRGHSYYGIMEKSKTEALVLSEGFELLRSWCVGESNIIEATTN